MHVIVNVGYSWKKEFFSLKILLTQPKTKLTTFSTVHFSKILEFNLHY